MSGKNKSSLGLTGLGNLSSLLDDETAIPSNQPLDIAMDLIDEDPNQPRTENNPGFSDASLKELAGTIETRGVKTPISVRDNPDSPGRYIINHGARRFRASRIAKKTTIPGYIDNDYIEADQVIENLQRNELTAREIADFIGRELAKGQKKGVIAKTIGKSAAFITQHANLLDLPEPIAAAFNSDRVRDVTVVNELITAYKSNQKAVTDWLDDEEQEITRGSVKLLREFLDDKTKDKLSDFEDSANENSQESVQPGAEVVVGSERELSDLDKAYQEEKENSDPGGEQSENPVFDSEKTEDPNRLKKAIVEVVINERTARIMLNKRPSSRGFAWFKYEDDGQEFEDELSNATLSAIIEA